MGSQQTPHSQSLTTRFFNSIDLIATRWTIWKSILWAAARTTLLWAPGFYLIAFLPAFRGPWTVRNFLLMVPIAFKVTAALLPVYFILVAVIYWRMAVRIEAIFTQESDVAD